MSPTRRRRPALLTALALLLAVESVTTVAVRAAEITDARTQLAAAAAVTTAPHVAPRAIPPAATALRPPVHDVRLPTDALAPAATTIRGRVRADAVRRTVAAPRPAVRARVIQPKPAKPATGKAATHKVAARSSGSARRGQMIGRNHVWSPALGIDKRVYAFSCSRSRKPGNVVYRWGCAGRNNVYLMGHARTSSARSTPPTTTDGSPRPEGLLRRLGRQAPHLRGSLVEGRRTDPGCRLGVGVAHSPSMTLQTCLGRHSEYRLDGPTRAGPG